MNKIEYPSPVAAVSMSCEANQRFLAAAIVLFLPLTLSSQPGSKPQLQLRTGDEIYREPCIGCHGPHGEGQPNALDGLDPPKTLPHVPKCEQTKVGRTPCREIVEISVDDVRLKRKQ